MQDFSNDHIRTLFRTSQDFNELFEAFRVAIERNLNDLDAYRELFWNTSLKPEELLFFAKKLGEVFPDLGYETYLWLSNVFETRFDTEESVELAFLCLKKASKFNPKSVEPFLSACNLYDQDLKIPTLQSIMAFLKNGVEQVDDPKSIYQQLAVFYSMLGNDEMYRYFQQKSRPNS